MTRVIGQVIGMHPLITNPYLGDLGVMMVSSFRMADAMLPLAAFTRKNLENGHHRKLHGAAATGQRGGQYQVDGEEAGREMGDNQCD